MTKAANDDREDPAIKRYKDSEYERELGRQACIRGDVLPDDITPEFAEGYGEILIERQKNEQ